MNFTFLIKDNEYNMSNNIEYVCERIKGALQKYSMNPIRTSNNIGIYELLGENKLKKYIECYRIDTDNMYLVNMISITEDEKNIFMEILVNDQLFKECIVIFDSLSNEFIGEEFRNFSRLENNFKQYFALTLIKKYNWKAFEIIEDIKTKEELSTLPINIKSNLQRITLDNLLVYMLEKPLGGMEYETYFEKYEETNLEKLNEIIDENIFKDVQNIISKDKKSIIEYRNVVCHNRILNCEKMEYKHSKIVIEANKKLCELNNSILNSLFNTSEEEYYLMDRSDIITFAYKKDKNNKLDILFLINLLCKLNIVFKESNLIKNEENTIIYKCNDLNLTIYLAILKPEDYETTTEEVIISTITFDHKNISVDKLSDIIIKELNDGDIIILYDSQGIEIANELSKRFNILENLFREYIVLYKYIEKINENIYTDKLTTELRIGKTGKLGNGIYDYDFITLLNIITAPNGGKNNKELKKSLKEAIERKDTENIEFLLTNMLDHNNDLKIIVKHWCELYKYRTLVAHFGIISRNEFNKILGIINSIKATTENILIDYLIEHTDIFSYKKEIELDNFLSIKSSVMDSKKCDICFNRNNGEQDEKEVLKVEDIYPFRCAQLINALLNINDNYLGQIFSYEYLNERILNSSDKLLNIIQEADFKEKIDGLLEKLGLDKYATFRIITIQEQILEEKIGDLLNSIHGKINSRR